jgi:tetratricopeptide (TPR) repeat protein
MAGRIEKTVFISYRRTNFWTALAVFQNLNANGYDVFFDYKSIPSGDFAQVIDENIKSRAHFLVILSPSALDRCSEPGDWLRREIETAIDNRRNIIPLIMEGFDFGSPPILEALTGKLTELKKYNGLSIPAEYFDEAMTKLKSDKFLSRSLESVAHPVSETTIRVTKVQKSAASQATPVEIGQITAEEWYERGNMFLENNNLDQAARCYQEAYRLKHDSSEASIRLNFALNSLSVRDKLLHQIEERISQLNNPKDIDRVEAFINLLSESGKKNRRAKK